MRRGGCRGSSTATQGTAHGRGESRATFDKPWKPGYGRRTWSAAAYIDVMAGGAANLDWLFWLLGGVLAFSGVGLGAWALFWDRAKRRGVMRRRCPKCWYDMAGTPGLTCPECGRAAKTERRLGKTRRRWITAILCGLIAIAGYLTTLAPVAYRDGWHRAVPTSVLVFLAPMDDAAWTWSPSYFGLPPSGRPRHPLLAELVRRCDERSLWSWQWQVFFDRRYAAQPLQRQWLVKGRDVWPRDVPMTVRIRSPLPLASDDDLVLRLRVRGSGKPGYSVRSATTTTARSDGWRPNSARQPRVQPKQSLRRSCSLAPP